MLSFSNFGSSKAQRTVRVEESIKIAKELDLRYKSNALKPRKKITLDVISEMNEDSKNIAIIGDRIFTDVLAGNRLGLFTILIKRLNLWLTILQKWQEII